MVEPTPTISVRQSPLHETHARAGAEMIEREGWILPASYGDLLREYAAVREGGAGLIDLSQRGRIRVNGSEATQFLNGLITNDVKALAQNQWMPAVFPTVQGRLIASVRVIRCPDEQMPSGAKPVFLLDTEAITHQAVLKAVERFTLAGDFHVSDLTDTTALVSIQGRKAAEITNGVFGETVADIHTDGARTIKWNGSNVLIVRSTHTAEDGFDLFVDSSKAGELWDVILQKRGQPVGFNALEMLRIEAGIPRYGVDIDDTLVVSETNLDDAVSYTKGCYVGQEIIARIKYRGHVAKKVTGVIFDSASSIEPEASVRSTDRKDIGRLTSATYSPHLGRTVALAVLKYQYLADGTNVNVSCGDQEVVAQVTTLPFIKGGWFKT
jgi:folate-binding protein YgfZ